MSEIFLREDVDFVTSPEAASAQGLLQWAESLAVQTPSADIYRHKEGRTTLRFEHLGRSFFLKLHRGIGWPEIVKNLLQMRLPVLGASNEYFAVQALQREGVDTLSVAAYASMGKDPARVQSLLVTDDLVGTVSLEDYCADWAIEAPLPSLKIKLIRLLAMMARRMHGLGINHRDFYLCHFHLDLDSIREGKPRCHLIDLHRAQMRTKVPRRWLIKDLAGLYFSAMDCGLTRRDQLRFMRTYCGGSLRQALGPDLALWRLVERRALKLYQKEHAGGTVAATNQEVAK